MTLSSLVSKVKHAIEKGEFEEHISQQIDNLFKSNPDASHNFSDKLYRTNIGSKISNDNQRYTLLRYLHRLLPLQGHENLTPWYDFIIGNLMSHDKRIIDELVGFLIELMIEDTNIRDLVFVKYFASKGPNELKMLVAFQQTSPKVLQHFIH